MVKRVRRDSPTTVWPKHSVRCYLRLALRPRFYVCGRSLWRRVGVPGTIACKHGCTMNRAVMQEYTYWCKHLTFYTTLKLSSVFVLKNKLRGDQRLFWNRPSRSYVFKDTKYSYFKHTEVIRSFIGISAHTLVKN